MKNAQPLPRFSLQISHKRRLRESVEGYLFILPAFLGVFIFGILPLFFAGAISLYDYPLLNPQKSIFIGLANYLTVFRDNVFWQAALNTVKYALIQVPMQAVLGLVLALLILRRIRGITLFRTIFYLPVVVSLVIASTVWQIMYNRDSGILNSLLSIFGIPRQPFLTSIFQAIPSLAVMVTWKMVGFTMIIFLAGLQAIPEELYEAAKVDGASTWRSFWSITLPLLRRPALYILVVGTMNALQLFTPIYIITQGGPMESTTTLVYEIYRTAFHYYNMGLASAQAMIFLGCVLAITITQFRLLRSDNEF